MINYLLQLSMIVSLAFFSYSYKSNTDTLKCKTFIFGKNKLSLNISLDSVEKSLSYPVSFIRSVMDDEAGLYAMDYHSNIERDSIFGESDYTRGELFFMFSEDKKMLVELFFDLYIESSKSINYYIKEYSDTFSILSIVDEKHLNGKEYTFQDECYKYKYRYDKKNKHLSISISNK